MNPLTVLAIETSCDETAIALMRINTNEHDSPIFSVLGNTVASQIALHQEYGGVFPAMAKREHAKNIPQVLLDTLTQAGFIEKTESQEITPAQKEKIEKILEREEGLTDFFINTLSTVTKPAIDAIAVTYGPGLEPALWVGISFAKALSILWDIPLVPVNHMEGHALSILVQESAESKNDVWKKYSTAEIAFPSIALLISGGHTELVLIKDIGEYTVIGKTRDDAVGEAFDKVARMLGLPYPGGPEISKYAAIAREKTTEQEDKIILPRPMLHSGDFDFSFSGIKTSVLYKLRDERAANPEKEFVLSDERIQEYARAFEDAITDVLVSKTLRAVEVHGAHSLIVGGGVAANTFIRKTLTEKIETDSLNIQTYFPEKEVATDNAIMIGIVSYFNILAEKIVSPNNVDSVRANGNLEL